MENEGEHKNAETKQSKMPKTVFWNYCNNFKLKKT